MRAMLLDAPGRPLRPAELPAPVPGPGRCWSGCRPARSAAPTCTSSTASCPHPKLPLIPGHEIVGEVVALRSRARHRSPSASASASRGSATPAASAPTAAAGTRTCATRRASPATRWTAATPSYAVADAAYCFPLPDGYDDARGRPAALRRPDRLPLAAHGWRRAAGSASTASAPPPTSSPRSRATRAASSSPSPAPATRRPRPSRAAMGAAWAGESDEAPPEPLDAAIIFAPVGGLVPAALAAVRKGGTVVCGGIHMSDIPSFPYAPAVGGARRPLGREPDPPGRGASSWPWPARAGADRDDDLPAGARQRGARRPADGPAAGGGGAGPLARPQAPAAAVARRKRRSARAKNRAPTRAMARNSRPDHVEARPPDTGSPGRSTRNGSRARACMTRAQQRRHALERRVGAGQQVHRQHHEHEQEPELRHRARHGAEEDADRPWRRTGRARRRP